jgi:hypothetical protein
MRDPLYRQMTDFLVGLGTTDVEHTGKGFLAHLIGVYKDLERWGGDLDVCRAGMFHSIYGTELFQKFCLPLERRSEVRDLIGERAEWLSFLNSVMDRGNWDRIFLEQTGERAVINRITGEKYRLSQGDFDDLVTVHVCDWLEQVPRSHDWDYRRAAYQAMAEYLGGIAAEECDRVYGLETAAH